MDVPYQPELPKGGVHFFAMKMLGGEWSKADLFAALTVIVGILAIPGMPKLFHWDDPKPNVPTAPLLEAKSQGRAQANQEATPIKSGAPSVPMSSGSGEVVSSGVHTLSAATDTFDLDEGRPNGSREDISLAGGHFMIVNEAKWATYSGKDFESVSASTLAGLTYVDDNSLLVNDNVEGTIFGVLTNQKNFAAVQVLNYSPGAIKIRWKTLHPPT
jgi:hypothetical protein